MYKVTLSMPIYNVAPYVERALLSALNQTFESIEFLLVDDRGTDNSMEIVRRIIENHPRGKDVRIIEHPHNIGLGAARNTAIDNAQGEYLFFMDSDDEITQDCIQVLYDRMMEEKVDIVVGSFTEVTVEGKRLLRTLKDLTKRGKFCLSEYKYKERQYIPIMTWNKLYSLSFLRENEIRCYPNHLGEDMVFSMYIQYHANSFSTVSLHTALYCRRDDSVASVKVLTKRHGEQILDLLCVYKKLLPGYLGSNLKAEYLHAMLYVASLNMLAICESSKLSVYEKKHYYKSIKKISEEALKNNKLTQLYSIKSFVLFIYYMMPFSIKWGTSRIIRRYMAKL